MTEKTHEYHVYCSWTGSTGNGYRNYDRQHKVAAEPGTLTLSADPAFRGDPLLFNPEQLLVMAASSCQLLSLLAICARARIDVVSYEDEALGTMPEELEPVSIRNIVLRPRITAREPATPDEVVEAVHEAHDQCYIANSLLAEVSIEPTITIQPARNMKAKRRPASHPTLPNKAGALVDPARSAKGSIAWKASLARTSTREPAPLRYASGGGARSGARSA